MATLTNERGHIGSAGISLPAGSTPSPALDGADDAVTRDRLAALVTRGHALQAMGRRQGPVASVAASLAKLGVTELMFDAAVLEADLAGADAMLAGGRVGPGARARPAAASPAAPPRCRRTSSASASSACPRSPARSSPRQPRARSARRRITRSAVGWSRPRP